MEHDTNNQELDGFKNNIAQRLVDLLASEYAHVETGERNVDNRIHADATFAAGEELTEQGLTGLVIEYDGPTTVIPLETQCIRLDTVNGEHEYYIMQRPQNTPEGEWQIVSEGTGLSPANRMDHQRLLSALEGAYIDTGLNNSNDT